MVFKKKKEYCELAHIHNNNNKICKYVDFLETSKKMKLKQIEINKKCMSTEKIVLKCRHNFYAQTNSCQK